MEGKTRKIVPWTIAEDEIIIANRQSMSAKQLVELLPGRTWDAVRSRIKHLGIKKETKITVKCNHCNSEVVKNAYEAKRNRLNFCGNECKNNYFIKDKNPNWNGGESSQNGYRMVRAKVSEKTKYKREHRIVIEKHLGRKLKDWEIVHHVNGDKTDNRIENLEVMNRSEHTKLHWNQGDYDRRMCKLN